MKVALLALLLAGCTMERPEPVNRPLSDLEGYIIDVCLEREGEAQAKCIEEAREEGLRAGLDTGCRAFSAFARGLPQIPYSCVSIHAAATKPAA